MRRMKREEVTVISIVGAAISFIFIVGAIYYAGHELGKYECNGCQQKDIAKTINDARSSLFQVFAGVAGALAIFFTWRSFDLAREGRTSDNFTKAVEQLGDATVHVRVGGIYGLGRLLRTADLRGDYWPLMDILTAFLRQSTPIGTTTRSSKPLEDLQAAINVLARRSILRPTELAPFRIEDSPVDLHETDLSGLWMAGGHYEWGLFARSLMKADLQGAKFNGADFTEANLQGANLTDANFEGADFTGTDFGGAKLLRGILRDVTKMRGANFTGTNLTSAIFDRADLRGANLSGAIVRDADFSQATLDAKQLDHAIGNSQTKLSSTFPRPTSCT